MALLKPNSTSKYSVIWDSDKGYNTYTKDDCEYAEFLKNLDRIYFESNSNAQKSNDAASNEASNNDDNNNNNNKSTTTRTIPVSFEVSRRKEKFKDSYEFKMKDITQSLLQEKQNERVLKRKEGDIIKQQYNLNKSRHQFESVIGSNKFKEEIQLREKADEFEKQRKKFFCEKARLARIRMKAAKIAHDDHMGKTRRATVNISRLMREYDNKKKELDTNAHDIMKLMDDYETKLAREENQNKILQKDLEEIASTLHMEMLKLKSQEEELNNDIQNEKKSKVTEDTKWEKSYTDFMSHTDSGIKTAENKRTSMDADLARVVQNHEVKSRSYGGSLNTIRHKLRTSENNQKQLIDQAEYLNLLMKRVASINKVEAVSARHEEMIQKRKEEVVNENKEREEKSLKNLHKSQIDTEAKNEGDNYFHLKNEVRKDKETEQKIYKQMNDASKDMKQQAMVVDRLEHQLRALENSNSSTLHKQMRSAKEKEEMFRLELNRHQTALSEMKARRDMHFNELLSHRKVLESDEIKLEKSRKAQKRLENISQKSDTNFFPLL